MKTDVIIVGAGPTGLALAGQLIRYGVDFVIFDKKETTTPYSKAIGVQARTLEIYEQIDLADKLVGDGWITEKACLVEGGRVRGEVELAEYGKGMSPYPFLLIVEQGIHERLLYDYIKAHGRDVLWNTELESFTQDADGVVANVKTASGEREVIGAKFLIGCDGAKSFVRHAVGLEFEGSTFERLFYVADAQVDWSFSHKALYACLAKNTITAFFPMVGENHYRIVGTFPEGHEKEEGEFLYEEIERQIKQDTELELDIHDVKWFSVYKVHTRHVSRFSNGRCFLAGDAAHIHSPAGAQGMNTGIQDAYNLAWKIATVLRGTADAAILESYNIERLENARNLLKTTDRLFNVGASPDLVLAYFRTHIFPHIANFVLNFDSVRKFIFPLISQIGINYRHSPLSAGDGKFSVKAGDRMPYFEIDGASLYDKLREPKFHLLTFFDGRNNPPPVAEFQDRYGDLFDFHQMPLYPSVAETFGASETFSVLLRPDNYIGTISAGASFEAIENYLNRILKAEART
jgi:2-polyprenyl-6-methoxyphenol hydroxylase-like FAD-dependent oxidoreductase